MASDSVALLTSVGLALLAKGAFQHGLHLKSYLRLWPFLFAFLVVYRALGLYSIVGLKPRQEFQRGAASSAVLFLLLAAVTVSLRGAQQQFTWTLVLSMAMSMALQPALRIVTRKMFASRNWWGYPAVIFGSGSGAERILRTMRSDSATGMKPVALVDANSGRTEIDGVPVFPTVEGAQAMVSGRYSYAVFAAKDFPAGERSKMIDRYSEFFSHILVVPDLKGFTTLMATSKSIGGMLGLEIGRA
jgi:FlaA1/EpsC-like NDP-sugar epimerase